MTDNPEARAGLVWGAASFAERTEWLREGHVPPLQGKGERRVQSRRDDWVRYYLKSWRLLDRRLAAAGSDREEVLALLARPDDLARPVSVDGPSWLARLDEILAQERAAPPRDPRQIQAAVAELGVGVAMRPFVHWAHDRFVAGLAHDGVDAGPLLDRTALGHTFAAYLLGRLSAQATRTLVLNMHGLKLAGRLPGDSPAARFAAYVNDHLVPQDRRLAILADYPVLLRLLTVTTENVLAAWRESLVRLRADWPALRDTLNLRNARRLAGLQAGLGDPHRGARTVMRLNFDDGSRLIYKPKPLAVERHFAELLEWLNRRGVGPGFRTLNCLDRGDYGWVEYVTPSPCDSAAEAEAFYRRQGGLLAVLHLLDATDIHLENILAVGAHPVVVDLETVFQNLPATPGGARTATARRDQAFAQLVTRTGMLPMRIEGAAGVVEMSGLAGAGGQDSPFEQPRWVSENSDDMRIEMRRGKLPESYNLPTIDGQPVSVLAYRESFLFGFAETYRGLAAHAGELAAGEGPLAAFRHDEVRHVLRETRSYVKLLGDAAHPGALRDGLDRDILLDTLWNEVSHRPHLARAVEPERAEMWNGDVPYFTTTPDSRDLDSLGGRIPGAFAEPALRRVRRRLRGFGPPDLARQTYAIEASLAALEMKPGAPPPSGAAAPAHAPGPEELRAGAVAIGERLAELAIDVGDEAYWPNLHALSAEHYAFGVAAGDLYAGGAGIALFLAQLGAECGREDFTRLAERARRAYMRELSGRWPVGEIGAFTGMAGHLYATLRLAGLWHRPDLLEGLPSWLSKLEQRLRHDRTHDILGGAAGCLVVLLRLHEALRDSASLDLARACGDRLVEAAVPAGAGRAWPPLAGERPLAGFSHGAAGIAWALLELARATGEASYRETAQAALRYERDIYDDRRANWPDLRDQDGAGFMWAWCHGAPGIGLGRVLCAQLLDDPALSDEVTAAHASTEAHGFGGSDCLCHGDLGNAELSLLRGGGEGEGLALARRRAGRVLAEWRDSGRWRCGVAGFAEVPGLMMGLSGIGYQLLRLAAPERVPSVLTLEGPPA